MDRRPRSCSQKPFLHLHTQYNREIPWADIDMDFMNLNQAAHGDREFGFIAARLRLERKVVVGHWGDAARPGPRSAPGRAPRARRHDWQTGRIARFGDNMREVAVTEGDKVEAQRRLGFSDQHAGASATWSRSSTTRRDAEVDELVATLPRRVRRRAPSCGRAATARRACATARGSSSGLRRFLEDGGFTAFTDTFEDLHGLTQLPGLAVQRLMADGYGFGGEGDWKTAAMVRAMKVMSAGPRRAASRSWRTTPTT